MKKLRKPLIITLIAAAILAVLYFFRNIIGAFLVVFCWFSFMLLGHLLNLLEPLPPPQIQYAEMPFELVYEIDDEIYEVKDTLICEYDGWHTTEGGLGKERSWKKSLKSGKEDIILYENDDTVVTLVTCNAAVYMGDPDIAAYNKNTEELRFAIDSEENGYTVVSSQRELYAKSGIVIWEWDAPDPIENSFSYFNYFDGIFD